jgi:hypothetical protein
MAETVTFNVRLPADIAERIERDTRRMGISKTAAVVGLIRAGEAVDSGRLLAEIQAAHLAADAARLQAEKNALNVDRLCSKLTELKTQQQRAHHFLGKKMDAFTAMVSRPLSGMATGKLGRWIGELTLNPSCKPEADISQKRR